VPLQRIGTNPAVGDAVAVVLATNVAVGVPANVPVSAKVPVNTAVGSGTTGVAVNEYVAVAVYVAWFGLHTVKQTLFVVYDAVCDDSTDAALQITVPGTVVFRTATLNECVTETPASCWMTVQVIVREPGLYVPPAGAKNTSVFSSRFVSRTSVVVTLVAELPPVFQVWMSYVITVPGTAKAPTSFIFEVNAGFENTGGIVNVRVAVAVEVDVAVEVAVAVTVALAVEVRVDVIDEVDVAEWVEVMVFVFGTVQVTVSVTGHTFVGVTVEVDVAVVVLVVAFPQQMVRSTLSAYSDPSDPPVKQNEFVPPATYPGNPER